MIREIYESSLANLPSAIGVFDEVLLYDASAFDEPPRLVARLLAGKTTWRSTALPRWCGAALE